MKILFISDIHGVFVNLDKIESIIKRENIDKLVVLGDLYYRGFNRVESGVCDNFIIREFLNRYRDILICMRGNCDSDVDIDKSGFPINSDLSLINVDGIDIYLTHGDKYSYDYRDKFNGKGVLIYGHYHIPYIRKGDDVIYICVGSISLPRDEMDYSYCIYEDRRFCLYSIDGVELDSVVI